MCYNGRVEGRGLKRNTCGVYCVTLWGIFLLGEILRGSVYGKGNNIGDSVGSVTLGKINWNR